MSPRCIAIVAGGGLLPGLLASAIRAAGQRCVVANLRGESLGLEPPLVDASVSVAVGALGKTLKFLKQQGADEVLLAGGVDKTRLFRTARPDLAALKLLKSLPESGDDRLLRALTKVFEDEGFPVGCPVEWLPEHRATEGRMSGRAPGEKIVADLAFGLRIANAVGELEIGQTVVVRQGCVVAVEAVEGTDAMLGRAGPLAKRGAVVVKAIKPNQDHRLDMPTVGVETLKVMADNNLKWLGLEVGCLMLDKPALLAEAKRLGIGIAGLLGKR
ncbi:MAG: UDP-2,3-diacylglucosamine diphosphatase LpxI [Myxococcota bacterium]|nr:UDP-2,3-diacylglucosamine diphosphatase LpxI [Myxococcota bacterium]